MDNGLHLLLDPMRETLISVQRDTQWQKEASGESQASGKSAKQLRSP
jgi:hypothetical protein